MDVITLPRGIKSAAEMILDDCDSLRKQLSHREDTLRQLFSEVLQLQGLDPEQYRFDRDAGALRRVDQAKPPTVDSRSNHEQTQGQAEA